MTKKSRGYYEENISQILGVSVSVLSWKDNKVVNVFVLSTFAAALSEKSVKRLNRNTKQKVEIPCPDVISEYNAYQGRVDLLDSYIGRSRIFIKSRKWYLKIFFQCLDMVRVNAFLCYRKSNPGIKTALATFKEDLARTFCQFGSTSPTWKRKIIRTKRKYTARKALPTEDTRKDGSHHWPLFTSSRQRCRHPSCKQKSFITCSKCDNYFCLRKGKNCFLNFNTSL